MVSTLRSSIRSLGTPNKTTSRTPSPLRLSKVSFPKRARSMSVLRKGGHEVQTHGNKCWWWLVIILTIIYVEINPSTSLAHWPAHDAKGALSSPRGRACRKRYLRTRYRTIYRHICILHKARDGAKKIHAGHRTDQPRQHGAKPSSNQSLVRRWTSGSALPD